MSAPDNTPVQPTAFPAMPEGHQDPAEVAAVQRFLMRLGPTFAMKMMPEGADGVMGPHTRAAIEAFQDKFHIDTPHRGQLDPKTIASMNELRGELASHDRQPDALAHVLSQLPDAEQEGGTPQTRLHSVQLKARDAARHLKHEKPDPESVKLIQEVLQSRGYSLGPAGVDGVPGKHFKAALADYQRDAGLLPVGMLPDGGVDPATHEMIKMDDKFLQQEKAGPRQTPIQPPKRLGVQEEMASVAPAVSSLAPSGLSNTGPTGAFQRTVFHSNRPMNSYRPGEMIPGLGVVAQANETHVHLPSQNSGFGSINLGALIAPAIVAPVVVARPVLPVVSIRLKL